MIKGTPSGRLRLSEPEFQELPETKAHRKIAMARAFGAAYGLPESQLPKHEDIHAMFGKAEG